MSIKFVCSCGKHLRARDEMAARRSRCPRCGEPVGIPSLQPTHTGTVAAPMTPQERRRLSRLAGRSDGDSTAVATALPPQPPFGPTNATTDGEWNRPVRLPRQLETHWYECLLYPFFCGRLLTLLAVTLAFFSSLLALVVVPKLPRLAETSVWTGLPYTAFALPPLLALAYVCGTVECALASALAGQGPGEYWPGGQVGLVLKSVLRWLVCCLAGPVVPAVLACYFWLNGGDLTVLDWIVIGELAVLAVAYWLLAVVRTSESGRLRDANPVRVGQLVRRLGLRAVVPVFVVPVLTFAHVLLGFVALGELHRAIVGGWLLLTFVWGSALFSASFVFRLLGVWCYRKV
jgi:hypothetical protein